MKINWKLRLQSPAFWVFVITIVFTNLSAALNVKVEDLTTWNAVWQLIYHAIINPTVLVPTLISVYLGAVDYTSKGLSDTLETLGK